MGEGSRKKLKVIRRIAPESMPAIDFEAAECILARLVALAYAADHSELFHSGRAASAGAAPAAELSRSTWYYPDDSPASVTPDGLPSDREQ